jgi:hypothetical protein
MEAMLSASAGAIKSSGQIEQRMIFLNTGHFGCEPKRLKPGELFCAKHINK